MDINKEKLKAMDLKPTDFKCRLWDSENKKMINAPNEYLSALGFAIQLDGRIYEKGVLQKQLTIMQFTGLTDNDGKEIFEGDRLRYVFLKIKGDALTSEEGLITVTSIFDFELMAAIKKADSLEIIGNVHENPLTGD